jgi:hypothetical protein
MSTSIFLLASERSGTNLVRRRLSESQAELLGPAPLHVLKHLHDAQPAYGDLAEQRNFDALLEDALGLAYEHFSPWDERITVAELRHACAAVPPAGRSVVAVMDAMYTLYGRRKAFTGYICKDNDLFDYTHAIAGQLPEAGFIHLHRDPRDVIASQLRRPMQSSSVVRLAELWRDEQIKCINALVDPLLRGRCLRISYETLLADEPGVLASIHARFGLTPADNRARKLFAAEHTEIVEWRNLDKATDRSNTGGYRNKLTRRQIAIIESITWHQMRWLGYRPENPVRPRVGRLAREFDVQWARLIDGVTHPWRVRKLTGLQRQRRAYLRRLRERWQ